MQPIYRTNPFVTVEGNGRGRTNAYISGGSVDVGADIFRTALSLISRNLMNNVFQVGFHYNVAGYDIYLGEVILAVVALIPLIIFRVCNVEQFKHFSSMLKTEHIHLVTAFNFPKFNMEVGEAYYEHLEYLNQKYGEVIYGMPILESKEMAYLETRIPELMGVKEILDRHKNLVLNVRVGGTDWSSVFGVRRGINYTLYDIMTVSDCLKDVLNVFSRHNDYSVSGPVWEYFRVTKDMKFEDPLYSINKSLLNKRP